jgi:hypothetical protein
MNEPEQDIPVNTLPYPTSDHWPTYPLTARSIAEWVDESGLILIQQAYFLISTSSKDMMSSQRTIKTLCKSLPNRWTSGRTLYLRLLRAWCPSRSLQLTALIQGRAAGCV